MQAYVAVTLIHVHSNSHLNKEIIAILIVFTNLETLSEQMFRFKEGAEQGQASSLFLPLETNNNINMKANMIEITRVCGHPGVQVSVPVSDVHALKAAMSLSETRNQNYLLLFLFFSYFGIIIKILLSSTNLILLASSCHPFPLFLSVCVVFGRWFSC